MYELGGEFAYMNSVCWSYSILFVPVVTFVNKDDILKGGEIEFAEGKTIDII